MPRGPLTRAPPTPLYRQKHMAHPATAWIWRSLQAASRDVSCRRRALGCSPARPGGRPDLEALCVSLPAVVASTRVVISAHLGVPVVPGRRHVSAGRQLAPNPSGHGGAAQPLRLPPRCTGSAGWRPAGRGAQRHARPRRQRTPAAALVGLPGPPPGAGEPGRSPALLRAGLDVRAGEGQTFVLSPEKVRTVQRGRPPWLIDTMKRRSSRCRTRST
jgi:hypothetical protein